ncbi:MAG: hypothetical protein M1834_003077 [Cirrosporium novae-zelandiae]|nr:MAG: hypothetical protein M1834_003077 [Cirrosporium novae-zelandiae]
MIALYKEAQMTDDYNELFQYIDSSTTLQQSVNMIAPDRCLAWNFNNVRLIKQTIEFQCPPQSENREDTKHWVAFALGFINWTLKQDITKPEKLDSEEEFEDAIRNSAEQLGLEDVD